jgi:hypothetical protein
VVKIDRLPAISIGLHNRRSRGVFVMAPNSRNILILFSCVALFGCTPQSAENVTDANASAFDNSGGNLEDMTANDMAVVDDDAAVGAAHPTTAASPQDPSPVPVDPRKPKKTH